MYQPRSSKWLDLSVHAYTHKTTVSTVPSSEVTDRRSEMNININMNTNASELKHEHQITRLLVTKRPSYMRLSWGKTTRRALRCHLTPHTSRRDFQQHQPPGNPKSEDSCLLRTRIVHPPSADHAHELFSLDPCTDLHHQDALQHPFPTANPLLETTFLQPTQYVQDITRLQL